MKKIKIGYDAKRAFHNRSGLGNYSRDLIRIVQEFSQDIQLFLYNPKKSNDLQVVISKNCLEIRPKNRFWKKLKSLWRTYQITKLAEKEPLDLYHGLSGEIPVGISKKIKTIVTIHDLIFLRFPQFYSFFDRKIHLKKFKYATENADHIIAISEQTKRDIIEFLNIPSEKISVVYQGCNHLFKKEYSKNEKENIQRKYNLPNSFVLSVGTIERRKNTLSIVKAIKDIDIPLVLIGRKTEYYKEIEDYILKYNLQDKVYTLEGISTQDLAIIYQMAIIFCYPSVFEGFGIPIIEALFSKVPIITTNGSCFPEAGGNHSLYINLENAEQEIKKHIINLLSNSQKRQEIIEKGYLYAQKFTDENVYKNLMEVYKKVTKWQE